MELCLLRSATGFAEWRAGRFPRVLRGRKRIDYRVAYNAT
jgi:hypothetical protein